VIRKITWLTLLLTSISSYAQEKEFEVYFDFDISEANNNSLKKIDTWIFENPQAVLSKIYGYCDAVGTDEYNDSLSIKRAKYVKKLTEKHNLKVSENFELKGFGENFKQSNIQGENRKVIVFYTIEKEEVAKPKLAESQMAIEIRKLEVGERLKLKNLNFYDQSGVIVPQSKPILQELLQVMKDNPKLKIEIQGHICCQLKTDIDDIARVRAQAIYYFLINNGIEKSRLNYKSFGSTAPIYKIPEKNEFEKNENRRVEIMILENI
jgi:outer membrane protein OmpA-like peptidoglycan-associated protein